MQNMSSEELNCQFLGLLEEIMYLVVHIDDPCDRMTIMQWLRRLRDLDDSTVRVIALRNEYTNFLRITLANGIVHLCTPFKDPPPEDTIRPLCEVLANSIAKKCPPIPITGPIEPVLSKLSDDGKVFMTVKQSPEGGLLCYVAVTPDSFQ